MNRNMILLILLFDLLLIKCSPSNMQANSLKFECTSSQSYFVLFEEFNGYSNGISHGITYVKTPEGQGAVFNNKDESRIQYPFNSGMVRQGTLEWKVKITNGYAYRDYIYSTNDSKALLFTTDIQYGDVFWPGSTWLYVFSNGRIQLIINTTKYNHGRELLTAEITDFRFNEWHTIGISFGSMGQHIMVDGKEVAANMDHTQTLGCGGTHEAPLDIPTIGESVSSFWANNRYEGGWEGTLESFRISEKQLDWCLSINSNI